MSIKASTGTRVAGLKQGLVIQIASSLTIMGSVMVAPMLPKLSAEFAATNPDAVKLVPLIATAPALAIAVFAPFCGILTDKFGRKALLIIGMALYGVFGFLPAILSDIHEILFARFAFGISEAIVMTCCSTLIADYWTGEARSLHIKRQTMAIGIVGAIFFVIGGVVGENSWRYPFFLYLFPVLLIPLVASLLWEPARRTEDVAEESTYTKPEISGAIIANYFLVFIGMVSAFIVPVMAPGFLVSIGVTSSSLIGICTGVGILATLLGTIAWPALRNSYGIAGVNVATLLLLAVGVVILAKATTYAVVMVAVIIHGFGAGFLVPNTMLALLQKLPVAYRGRGVGGFNSALYLGQFSSPLIIIGLSQFFGGAPAGIPAAVQIWAVVLLAIATAWLVLKLQHAGKLKQV